MCDFNKISTINKVLIQKVKILLEIEEVLKI